MTILAPLNAPNTDDSSTNVCIEDCYIESGDDPVAVNSGLDRYGIAMARPSSNIVVRSVSGTIPTCSGAEMNRGSNDHPDEGWDPKAIPKIKGISFVNVVSVNTTKAPAPAGIIGFNSQVFPLPGPQLQNKAHLGVLFLEFSREDLNFGGSNDLHFRNGNYFKQTESSILNDSKIQLGRSECNRHECRLSKSQDLQVLDSFPLQD
ncbi:hypothetical protein WN944_023204 [Citrus x changshan-huyou]|uniref:Polygalacturonase n=1 Tax=Citrus x changshan-huyou TaxID=2935761 RepID=A0AAP0MZW9_9ROSI